MQVSLLNESIYIGMYGFSVYLLVSGGVSKSYYDLTTTDYITSWTDNKIDDIYPDPIHSPSGTWPFGSHFDMRGFIKIYMLSPTLNPITFYNKLQKKDF